MIRTATEQLQEQAAACLERLKPRHAELATTLAADPEFRRIRTADARQRFAAEWLLDHTGGLRLPMCWIKELVANARSDPAQLML